MIITVFECAKRKMILWQSLHVEVNGDTHSEASASGDVINTNGRWLISR